jgi:U32 family peptidase
VRTHALSLAVTAHEGAPLVVVATGERGESAVAVGDDPLPRADARPLDLATARAQLGRLGGTPFHLGDVTLDVEGAPFVPVSLLNAVRRDWWRSSSPPGGGRGVGVAPLVAVAPAAQTLLATPRRPRRPWSAPARLHVLVRTGEQLDAALAAHAAGTTLESVTLDYLELYGLRPSVERARAAGVRVRVASPRVLKPAEQNVVRFLLDLEAELLVRSAGLLRDLVAVPPSGARASPATSRWAPPTR